ncbi:MAG: hypothetical protein EP330_17035 [Deltaproteobacteria bacterium]|nr:MAG: hypothetical protein EP330_17035 [Deltaproteobacteria bacterium]
MPHPLRALTWVPLLVLTACKGDGPGGSDDPVDQVFSATTVALEIDYVAGAEPYTGGVGGGDWELFRTNAEALFGEGMTVDVPTALADMSEVAVDAGPYTAAEILAIADEHRDAVDDGDTVHFYVVWLDGYLEDDDGSANESVLGVSIGDTRVIAMFKPVIEGSSLLDQVRRFSEQLVLTHEFGHAVGLVNNGIPNLAEHHDAEHGAHCTNDRCVMYWALEGAGEVAQFAQNYVTTGSTVVFDQDCLDDAAAVR